jgi:hypothetical protein
MSILTAFICSHLLESFEQEFIKYEPELQEQLLAEVKVFLEAATNWLNNKLAPQVPEIND